MREGGDYRCFTGPGRSLNRCYSLLERDIYGLMLRFIERREAFGRWRYELWRSILDPIVVGELIGAAEEDIEDQPMEWQWRIGYAPQRRELPIERDMTEDDSYGESGRSIVEGRRTIKSDGYDHIARSIDDSTGFGSIADANADCGAERCVLEELATAAEGKLGRALPIISLGGRSAPRFLHGALALLGVNKRLHNLNVVLSGVVLQASRCEPTGARG
jgi:hypothetical protein